ncbi:MAG: lactate racemase domain-containing protein [Pirellulaceae bacterium]|jgi:nickel-dependent lactate racemase|nr:lactate racemase domain-containing protein [Pirellulaceae bacterium]
MRVQGVGQSLQFGAASTLRLEIPAGTLLADFTSVAGDVLGDPAAAVRAALAEPLGYPPLAQAVVPGDRVVIAIDPAVPCAAQLITGVLQTLVSARIHPEDVTVLTAPACAQDAAWERAMRSVSADLNVVEHDPQDQAGLSYLAASKRAEPIYLNRHLCEADVIVPLNLLRPRGAAACVSDDAGLFPRFADEAARQRFHVAAASGHRESEQRRAEAEEVTWLLGLQLTLQVVAGVGNTVLHVLAGRSPDVADRGHALVEAIWSRQVPRRAQLVVAGITGGRHEQSWENFGRALAAALQVCQDNGTIVLCTALNGGLGPALRCLARREDNGSLVRRLQQTRSEDALSATLLAQSRDRQHIFLLSGLDEATVESLGVGYIADAADIQHLGRRADSCILLADAHRCALTVPDD